MKIGSFFSQKKPPLLGLDLSSTSVRLVELERVSGGYRLERYAIEPLPRGAIVDGNIENMQSVSIAIKQAWRRSGSSIKQMAVALPKSAVITQKIILPANLREDELELQVESEAGQIIPFAIDEVNLDFDVLGPTSHNSEDVEVLIAAARKEKVEDVVASVENAGLNVRVVDVESNAAQRVALHVLEQKEHNHKVSVLFQIGAQTTHTTIFSKQTVLFERDQALGGNQLTQLIVRNFGLSFEEAEAQKINHSLPNNYKQDVLVPFVESMAQDLQRSIQFFFTSSPHSRVDQILLSGGCALLPKLAEAVERYANVKTTLFNPFSELAIARKINIKQLTHDAPLLLTATGLAMRRFD